MGWDPFSHLHDGRRKGRIGNCWKLIATGCIHPMSLRGKTRPNDMWALDAASCFGLGGMISSEGDSVVWFMAYDLYAR